MRCYKQRWGLRGCPRNSKMRWYKSGQVKNTRKLTQNVLSAVTWKHQVYIDSENSEKMRKGLWGQLPLVDTKFAPKDKKQLISKEISRFCWPEWRDSFAFSSRREENGGVADVEPSASDRPPDSRISSFKSRSIQTEKPRLRRSGFWTFGRSVIKGSGKIQ